MINSLLHEEFWILQFSCMLILTGLIIYIERLFYRHIFSRLQKEKSFWIDGFVKAAHEPLIITIALLGVLSSLEIILLHFNGSEREFFYLNKAQYITIIIAIIWFLIRCVSALELNLYRLESDKFDKATLYILGRLLRITVAVIGILIILPVLGTPVSGLVAFGGGGALVIGLAAKDLLANFFGGLLIFLDRPFKIGEWIASPDREIEGTVESIGWRLTCIRSFDHRPLYIPNSVFSTIIVQNPSRMSHRRIKKTIGLRYEDANKIKPILAAIETMLRSHSGIDQSQLIMVHLIDFGPSSLDFWIYAFTKTINWVEFQDILEDVLFKVLEIVEQHGAQMAFPTTTMNIDKTIDVSLTQKNEVL